MKTSFNNPLKKRICAKVYLLYEPGYVICSVGNFTEEVFDLWLNLRSVYEYRKYEYVENRI
jgi:hypothetical protein